MACVCNEHATGPEVAIAVFSYLAAMSFMGMMRISRLRDGVSVACWVHTPEMIGFDSHSRYHSSNGAKWIKSTP